ncbi:MAG TPA: hypothetical protein VF390_00765 [Patescibacteria group bacterium]
MRLNPPKNTEKYFWTQHAAYKLRQYGLSAQRVIRVINNPQRKEEGIVEKTIAVMQPASVRNKNGKKTWSQEIWAMYRLRGSEAISNFQFPISKQDPNSKLKNYKPQAINQKQIKIISAWRYPGVSPQNNPIPEEILREISELS